MSAIIAAPSEQPRSEISPNELVAMGPMRLMVRVESIRYQGEDLNEYELVHPEGKPLPGFTAGSHIDLYFRDGRVRQYSLCNSEGDRDRYRIVVQREHGGRGGSKAIFDRVHVGRMLVISQPRNNFPLREGPKHLLIAGGIGITPLLSMALTLLERNAEFTLHYCTRTPQRTAFLHELEMLKSKGRVFVHHDEGDPAKGLDLRALLSKPRPDTHLYYCGPAGFMRAVAASAAEWPTDLVHSESFTPIRLDVAASAFLTADATSESGIPVGFEVKIASTGQVLPVPNDKSILQVLRENGFEVASSCESGLCGTCKVRYLEGSPDHQDYILEDEDKEKYILVCCSRSKSQQLVLDI